MSIIDSLILGILQGITEFLPVSSSGHLVVTESLLGLNVEGLRGFDVVVHLGTLLAIFVYFWRDIKGMLFALPKLFMPKSDDPYKKLILYILLATIPAVIFGFLGKDILDNVFRNPKYVGMAMLVVAFVFILGEMVYKNSKHTGKSDGKNVPSLTWSKALIIGLAQAVALIPGVSRSGSTIVAGLFQGIERSAAARFSFLLAIPAVSGAGLLTFLEKPAANAVDIPMVALLVGFVSSFAFGLMAIHFLMNFLKKRTLLIFAVYLLVIGVTILFFTT